ncbi:MAG: hypothetical protein JXB33_09210 [Clostridia bacterium]|nr:hypothetical protein [Clostridia bacterium]
MAGIQANRKQGCGGAALPRGIRVRLIKLYERIIFQKYEGIIIKVLTFYEH